MNPFASSLKEPNCAYRPSMKGIAFCSKELRARAEFMRDASPRPDSYPFVLTIRTYPDGFSLTDLGPAPSARRAAWHSD
jgi:hypothetical protein